MDFAVLYKSGLGYDIFYLYNDNCPCVFERCTGRRVLRGRVMIQSEENFIEKAFEALIKRGVARPSMLLPSTVTDRDINAFERQFGVRLPQLFRTYLQAYCYDFSVICAPMPLDGLAHDEPASEKGLCWIELVSLPVEEPLKNLYALMESFRRISTDRELVNMRLNSVQNFVPIGECDGPLCLDLTQENVQADQRGTWQICRFDETVFDWKGAGYIDRSGVVTGEKRFPDFKTLLEIYFYGKYDKAYEQQLRAYGEELPDYSYYIQRR